MAEKEKPNVVVRARNAIGALKRVVHAVARGDELTATEEVQEQRKSVCQGCENYRVSDKSCAVCGCYILAKITLTTEHCPKGRWGAVVSTANGTGDTIDGTVLLEHELDIREVLPAGARLPVLFNKYHEEQATGGCTSCRTRKYIREFERALAKDLKSFGNGAALRLRTVLPTSEYINLPSPRRWDELIKGAK